MICRDCGNARPCLGATSGKCRGGQEDFRALFLGEFKAEPTHPAPWSVNRYRNRHGASDSTAVFVVFDARRKCVAEFEDRETAETVVRMWNERHG